MSRELRPYQIQALAMVAECWRKGQTRVVAACPAGSGKTYTAAEAVKRAVERGKRVLWMAHRTELVDQARATIREHVGVEVGRIQADKKNPAPHSLVQVASVMTLVRREVLPPAQLVVVDECHHFAAPELKRVTDSYADAYHLLLSATPERSDGKPLADIADEIVAPVQPRELIAGGYLVPCEIVAPAYDLKKGLAWEPVAAWRQWAGKRRTIVFCSNKVHAEGLAAQFRSSGVAADCVTDSTPWERRRLIYRALAEGKLQVMTNVFVATEGLDIPQVEVVMLARTIGHAGMYIQCVGRAMRPSSEKGAALLIDLRGAVHKFGTPEADRSYTLYGEEGVETKEDEAKKRELTCAVCGAMRTGTVCPVCRAQNGMGNVPEVQGVPLEVHTAIPRSAGHFGEYVSWLVEEFRRPNTYKADAPRRAGERFYQKYRTYPDASWMRLFREWIQGKSWGAEGPPEGWPTDLSSPSQVLALHVTSHVVTLSLFLWRLTCLVGLPWPTLSPPISRSVAAHCNHLPIMPYDDKPMSAKSAGRATTTPVLRVKLYGEREEHVVDLANDSTARLHHFAVGLTKKQVELRAQVKNPNLSHEQIESMREALDITNFQLAAVREEVKNRDLGRGRAANRWARAFVAAAAQHLPPEVMGVLEKLASEVSESDCRAAEVRP